MSFLQHWNKEIIAQFYATIYFGYMGTERAMFWMTEEDRWHIIFSNFLAFSDFPMILVLENFMMKGFLIQGTWSLCTLGVRGHLQEP
jgi:hypothetical protein